MVIDESCAKNQGALEHVLSILSWDLSDSPYQTPVDTVELSRCVEWLRLMFSNVNLRLFQYTFRKQP